MGKGNLNIDKYGKATRFGSGQDATKGGRKKNIYTVLRETGYSIDDIRTSFREIAFYKYSEIESILKKKENYKDWPTIFVVVARAYLEAAKAGDFAKLKQIMDYLLPTANTYLNVHKSERNEVEETDTIGHVIVLSDDPLEERKRKMEEEYEQYLLSQKKDEK